MLKVYLHFQRLSFQNTCCSYALYLVPQYLLSTYYMLRIVLDKMHTRLSKTDTISALERLQFDKTTYKRRGKAHDGHVVRFKEMGCLRNM